MHSMKKRTMEKEHQAEERRKKVLMEIAGAVVVLTVIVSIGLSHLGTDKVNTSAGVKAIKKLEKADVSEVETKISNIEKEEKQATEDWQNRPLSEKFAHAVILGDSITTGFTVYDVLDTSKVVAEKGMHLDQTGDLIRTAAELKPEVLFLALGLNDISGTDGDTDAFIEKYKAVLANVREQMPMQCSISTVFFLFPLKKKKKSRFMPRFRIIIPHLKQCVMKKELHLSIIQRS